MRDDPTMKIMETMEAGQDPLLRLTDAERSENASSFGGG